MSVSIVFSVDAIIPVVWPVSMHCFPKAQERTSNEANNAGSDEKPSPSKFVRGPSEYTDGECAARGPYDGKETRVFRWACNK